MPFKRSLHVSSGVFQRHISSLVTLVYACRKQVCHTKEFFLAGLPHADYDCIGGAALWSFCICKMLLDTFEESINVLANIFGVVLFDNPF